MRVALLGDPKLVESFLNTLPVGEVFDVPEGRLRSLLTRLGDAAQMTQVASVISENSGKWLKLDDASAAALKQYGMSISRENGLMCGVVRVEGGAIAKHLQFVGSPARLLNPAVLMGMGGIMNQIAMEQQMAQINDYLKTIDGKLDDLAKGLQREKVGELRGSRKLLEKTKKLHEATGHITPVMWSKIADFEKQLQVRQSVLVDELRDMATEVSKETSVSKRLEALQKYKPVIAQNLPLLAETLWQLDQFHVLEIAFQLQSEIDAEEGKLHAAIHQADTQEAREEASLAVAELFSAIAQAAVLSDVERARYVKKSTQLVDLCLQSLTEIARAENSFFGVEREIPALERELWRAAVGSIRDETWEDVVGLAKETSASIGSGLEKLRGSFDEKRLQHRQKAALKNAQKHSAGELDSPKEIASDADSGVGN